MGTTAKTSKFAFVSCIAPYSDFLISTNDDLDLEVEAGGTRFEAGAASKDALATLLDGDTWMLYQNVLTGVLHWDFVRLAHSKNTFRVNSCFRVFWAVSLVSLLLMHSKIQMLQYPIACTDTYLSEPLGLLRSI